MPVRSATMTWLRKNRRRLSLFSALVLALQTLAILGSAQAQAAATSADGSNLVTICTAQGLKVLDLNAPDGEPMPVDSPNTCPLCIIGGCHHGPAQVLGLTRLPAVLIVYEPVQLEQPSFVERDEQPRPHQSHRNPSPRGPPAQV